MQRPILMNVNGVKTANRVKTVSMMRFDGPVTDMMLKAVPNPIIKSDEEILKRYQQALIVLAESLRKAIEHNNKAADYKNMHLYLKSQSIHSILNLIQLSLPLDLETINLVRWKLSFIIANFGHVKYLVHPMHQLLDASVRILVAIKK